MTAALIVHAEVLEPQRALGRRQPAADQRQERRALPREAAPAKRLVEGPVPLRDDEHVVGAEDVLARRPRAPRAEEDEADQRVAGHRLQPADRGVERGVVGWRERLLGDRARRYGLPLLPTTDVLAPSVALGHFFGRLGCFAAGCCYGRACDLPWPVTFTDPLAREVSGTPLGVPLHPAQLYEAAFNLANWGFLAWLFRRRLPAGTVVAAYFVTYGVGRFVIETFRGDPDRGFVLGGALSTSQAIAVSMVVLGIGLIVWAHRRKLTAHS